MNYHLKFLLLVVLRTLSWIIIIKTTVDKFTTRQIVSIVTRNHFRKTWMRPNKIHLGPVYSYLILISIRNFGQMKISFLQRLIDRENKHNSIREQTLCPSFRRAVTHVSVIRALSRHCVLRYFSARVCSVNLQLLTHTTPLFLLFLF